MRPGGGGPTGVMPTPADSIEEFKVGTKNQTADFNASAGAQVQLVTKRGTNQWHGTGYEYYLDNFGTRTPLTITPAVPPRRRPSYHYNRFGGVYRWSDHPEGSAWRESGTSLPTTRASVSQLLHRTRAVPSDGMDRASCSSRTPTGLTAL